MYDDNNKVTLFGVVATKPTFSHEIYGENFFDFNLKIKRLSGEEDTLSITMSEKMIVDHLIDEESQIALSGQLRSYNKIVGGKSKLYLTVFAKQIVDVDSIENSNFIHLEGYVCKPTIYRTTPFAREICDLLLAVNRAYNKSDYLPCIAWGKNAKILKNVSVGEKIVLQGRIQSRKYQKKLENGEVAEKIAYEVSICKLNLSSDYLSKTAHATEEIAGTLDL